MKKKAVIIPAAGSGTRMGSDIPKPFIEIAGKSILQRSIECFLQTDGVIQVLVATSENHLEECSVIFQSIKSDKVDLGVIQGGSERQFSIWNALHKLSEDVELVAVHDAVRPFVKQEFIDQCFEAASEFGCAVLSVPVKDTIKKVNKKRLVSETPDRSQLWQAQTPQVFKKEIILKAYESAVKANFVGTDDSSLVERIGRDVKIVEGGRENLKITYPIDLRIAELIINEGL